MKANILSFIIFFVTTDCCNKEAPQEIVPQPEKIFSIREGYKISEKDALVIAENAADLFSTTTKSLTRTVQKSIPIIVENSDGIDTLIYIVNYNDNSGYALISPDERSGEILAFIEEGSLHIQDTATNSMTKFLVNRMINYQISEFEKLKEFDEQTRSEEIGAKGIAGPISPSDKTYSYLRELTGNPTVCQKVNLQIPSYNDFNNPQGYIRNPDYYRQYGCTGTRRFSQLRTPKPTMLTTAWDQRTPFNDQSPLKGDGTHAAAGCAAVAVAQIMAYHSFPTQYSNGTSTNIASLRKYKKWSDFSSTLGKNAVATFLRKIGDLLNNNWETVDSPGTTAFASYVPICFSGMGYTNPGVIVDYDLDDVIKSLDKNMPLYVRGSSGLGGARMGR